jgi:hypothetical protein
MLADFSMPWCQEWGTMAAVGRRQLQWFISVQCSVLPIFHLGKVCVRCLQPQVQPTTNHLTTQLSP